MNYFFRWVSPGAGGGGEWGGGGGGGGCAARISEIFFYKES